MTDAERAKFREQFEERSIDELLEAHNMRGRMISAAREEQAVLHEIQTEKEHASARAKASGRAQIIGGDAIDDDKILSKFQGEDPSFIQRIKDVLSRGRN